MKLLRSLMGRRQFILASLTSFLTIVSERFTGAFSTLFKGGLATASEIKTPAMKNLSACVVYYSATGSTAKIAKAIYQGIKSVMNCDVAPINKIDPQKMDKYDFIAIGTPIWFFRETANVRLFVHNMPPMSRKPCIIFCTHGTEPSGTFFSLSQPIRKKAMTIIGWNDWYGDTTHYIHAVQPYITHGHPDAIDLKEAEAFGRDMAERAMKIHAGDNKP